MNIARGFIACLLSGLYVNASAINVGVLTTEIQDDQFFVAKEIKNQESVAKFVTTKVIEVDNPKSMVPLSTPAQVLVSPATLLVGPNKNANLKVYYQGEADDKERYYQLFFIEQNMSKASHLTESTSIDAQQKISIGTVLVVRPRKINFKYEVNGKGLLKNTGNTFIQALAIGKCSEEGKKNAILTSCSRDDFLLPGESVDFSKKMDIFEGYGLWRGMKYKYIAAE
ncbi:hypothetical protein [Iodobacter sp.]|uniref:hypothetical protein n=1 Tax=Iodobacter sp. TaxID=1915058 RepID=UPI0025DF8609|nr:hypothetical protein [Iodobacter sp.]